MPCEKRALEGRRERGIAALFPRPRTPQRDALQPAAPRKDILDRPLAGLAAGLAGLARPGVRTGRCLALGAALRALLAGHALELAFLALGEDGLGLLDARRHRHRRQHRLLGIVEVRDTLAGREVGETDGRVQLETADVELDPLGDLHRQSLDVDLA